MNETTKSKSGWKIGRRILISLAVLATLIAVFYAEEDWRGKRAWENCKRELEAKGAVMDWNAYIPPPVPDDQNFFKASKRIAYSFIHSRNDAESEFYAKQDRIQLGPTVSNTFPVFDNTKAKPLAVARLTILTPDARPESVNTNPVFKLNDPDAGNQIGKLIQKTVGQSVNGSQGFQFSEMQLSNLAPVQIFVEADATPSIRDLENFIPPSTATNIGRLRVEATIDKEIFQVELTDVHITAAADYLQWNDQYKPDFDEIREALKRPYARIDCDYSQPYEIQFPNFVMMRSLAQTLAQRAQCYLLLGQPEKALQELTLLNDSRRILEGTPTGKPMTLVLAMINVAITGVYVSTIADGMRLRGWQEPQLAALQNQLGQINLPSFVVQAFESEPAATTHTLETIPLAKIEGMYVSQTPTLWQEIKLARYSLVPRGWIYQNMALIAKFEYDENEGFDQTNNLILPWKYEDLMREMNAVIFRGNAKPYNFLAAMVIPNFTKAWQTTAHNQTLVNEAQIACALERYKLANGNYPETLDALAPQFIEKIPHDIIGGEPLKYRRTDDGKFLLYSVGWNEKDDGGLDSSQPPYGKVDNNGDWVWKN